LTYRDIYRRRRNPPKRIDWDTIFPLIVEDLENDPLASSESLASKYDVSSHSIKKKLRQQGYGHLVGRISGRKTLAIPENAWPVIEKSLAEGASLREIAEELGIKYTTLHYHVGKRGLESSFTKTPEELLRRIEIALDTDPHLSIRQAAKDFDLMTSSPILTYLRREGRNDLLQRQQRTAGISRAGTVGHRFTANLQEADLELGNTYQHRNTGEFFLAVPPGILIGRTRTGIGPIKIKVPKGKTISQAFEEYFERPQRDIEVLEICADWGVTVAGFNEIVDPYMRAVRPVKKVAKYPPRKKREPRMYRMGDQRRNPLQRTKKQVRDALIQAESRRQEAADILGVSPITLKKYIKRYDLAKEFPPKFGRGRPRAGTREEIKQAIIDAGGVRKDAAKALGITPGGLRKLVNKYGLRDEIPAPRRLLSEEEVFNALEETGGDREAAAKLLDISPLTLKNFIKLPRFEKFRRPMGGRRAITEDELTAALEQAGGSYPKAAEILDAASSTVGRLVRKFDLVDAYPPAARQAIPKEAIIEALQQADGSRQEAANILGVHPQTMSHLITKFKLRKRFPAPRITISKEQLLRAMIQAKGVKKHAAKGLGIGTVKVYELIKEYNIDKKAKLPQLRRQLKQLLKGLKTHIGSVYLRGDSYYLAVDENKFITIVDQEVIESHKDVESFEEQPEFQIGRLMGEWSIPADVLDHIVETYFPRPAKKVVPARHRSKPERDPYRVVFRKRES